MKKVLIFAGALGLVAAVIAAVVWLRPRPLWDLDGEQIERHPWREEIEASSMWQKILAHYEGRKEGAELPMFWFRLEVRAKPAIPDNNIYELEILDDAMMMIAEGERLGRPDALQVVMPEIVANTAEAFIQKRVQTDKELLAELPAFMQGADEDEANRYLRILIRLGEELRGAKGLLAAVRRFQGDSFKPHIRVAATRAALGLTEPKDTETLSLIIGTAMQDPDGGVFEQGWEQLLTLGEDAAPVLLMMVESDDIERSKKAMDRLIEMGPAAKSAAPQALELVQDMDKGPKLRKQAIDLLGAMASGDPQVMKLMAKVARSEEESKMIQRAARSTFQVHGLPGTTWAFSKGYLIHFRGLGKLVSESRAQKVGGETIPPRKAVGTWRYRDNAIHFSVGGWGGYQVGTGDEFNTMRGATLGYDGYHERHQLVRQEKVEDKK